MKPKIFSAIIFACIYISLSCRENINNIIETEIEPEPGRRDYVWTADTIKDRLWVNKFVGESANDVWAVNMDGAGNDCIYRYNGVEWYPFAINLSEPIYTLTSAFLINGKVWFTSNEGDIWLYNNGVMKKEEKFSYENNNLILFDLDGKNENEIYSSGGRGIGNNRDGSLCYYDGSKWIQKPLLKGFGGFYKICYSSKSNKYYLASRIDHEIYDTTRVYEYDESKLKTIWETSTGETCTFSSVDGYLFITLKNSVYRYYKNEFELLFTDNSQKFAGAIDGRNKNDLLVTAFDGIKHWNGTNLVYVKQFPQNIIVKHKMIVFENDVFFETKDNNTNYDIIYHGKLK